MTSALRTAASPNGSPKPKAGEPSALQVGGLCVEGKRKGGGWFANYILLSNGEGRGCCDLATVLMLPSGTLCLILQLDLYVPGIYEVQAPLLECCWPEIPGASQVEKGNKSLEV